MINPARSAAGMIRLVWFWKRRAVLGSLRSERGSRISQSSFGVLLQSFSLEEFVFFWCDRSESTLGPCSRTNPVTKQVWGTLQRTSMLKTRRNLAQGSLVFCRIKKRILKWCTLVLCSFLSVDRSSHGILDCCSFRSDLALSFCLVSHVCTIGPPLELWTFESESGQNE